MFDGIITDYQPDLKALPPVDILTLPSLIAWLELQDPDAEYNFMDCDGQCLIGLFYGGKKDKAFGPYKYWADVPDLYQFIAATGSWTFGAALTRAREAAGSES